MHRSGRHRGGLLLVLGALGVSLIAVIVVAPRVVASLVERQLRAGPSDDGASSEVDGVSFAWPARLRLEGVRLRLAADAEPAVAVKSVDVRFAPLRWLLGGEFLHITLAGPRVTLTRRPAGSFDLIDRFWSDGSPQPEPPTDPNPGAAQPEPVDATEPDDRTPPEPEFTEDVQDIDDAAARTSMDGSRWTRADDPFSVLHGTLTVTDGVLLIVDPAAGERTELREVRLAARVQTDEVITFEVSARQRGREAREGALTANGRVAFASGIRFWYDGAEILRRIELDAHARLAPCAVGDVDIGGDLSAAVHGAQATLTANGTLNHGTASARIEAQVVPGGRAVAGGLHVALRNVGLRPAFAPVLAQLNPIFDVGNGRLAGSLDTAWTGGWSASPAGRQRSRIRGRLRVKDLALSGAPLGTSILAVLGEPGGELEGDLLARDVRSENGRVSYERMALGGPNRKLTFAGTIAEDGLLRLTCEVRPRRFPDGDARPGAVGTRLRIPIVGWMDAPRLGRAAGFRRAGGADRTSSCESSDRRPT